jgi:flagellar protein FlgJ
MEISPHSRNVQAADIPLEKLSNNKKLSEQEKVAQASRQFEAVLVRQILSEAQKPVFGGKNGSVSNSIYQDMMTNELADQICHSGGLGLARSLDKELGHQLKPVRDGEVEKSPTKRSHAS